MSDIKPDITIGGSLQEMSAKAATLPQLPSTTSAYTGMITSIIINDEGGWKLTAIPGDSDGGWTFAGITHITWKDAGKPDYDFHEMAHYIASDMEAVKNDVIGIYFSHYCLEIIKRTSATVISMMLSCAVNVGTGGFVEIWKAGSFKPGFYFLNAWMDHYIDICVANPEKLKFLRGWANRVNRYRS